ncbi:MAG: phosphosulfolactate synthase [Lactobacillaceae bacterium]|jgi:phosphosulfolactate synthase|nr:phosphosulfolactate synthase [Lactobacillaceae bacterium]
MNAFSFLNKKDRTKPRSTGLTMMIDRGSGFSYFSDLLENTHQYIDFIKFGWGTSSMYESQIVMQKIDKAKSFDIIVYPGGTLLEAAILSGQTDSFFEELQNLGFNGIEISDGSTEVDLDLRYSLIGRAKDLGLHVISEVGKKNPTLDAEIELEDRINAIQFDLEAGSNQVLIEAREAGLGIGIYEKDGSIKDDQLSALAEIGLDKLIIEAPLKSQQTELLLRYGPSVNLGNIAHEEIIPLETLRQGLRGDTLGKI